MTYSVIIFHKHEHAEKSKFYVFTKKKITLLILFSKPENLSFEISKKKMHAVSTSYRFKAFML